MVNTLNKPGINPIVEQMLEDVGAPIIHEDDLLDFLLEDLDDDEK